MLPISHAVCGPLEPYKATYPVRGEMTAENEAVTSQTKLLATEVQQSRRQIHCVQKKNTHSHFLSYLKELFVDLNKNCSEYTQGLIDSDNVKIRYSLRSMT